MKLKQLLPTLLLTGLVSGAVAQGLAIGPKVGANFSTFGVTRYNLAGPIGEVKVEEMKSETERQIGPAVGLMVDYGFTSSIALHTELMYSVKGYKQNGTVGGVQSERDIKLNYIELPVLLRISAGSETVRGNFMIGPYVSYLLGGKDDYKVGGVERSGELNYKFTEENPDYHFHKADFGATIGAGVSFITGSGTFLIDGRYSHSIPEIMTYDPRLGEVAVRNRNSTVGISIGWMYQFPYSAPAVNDYGGIFNDD